MALETGTYISDLNSANPPGTDLKSQGDDHIRLIKATILATFPNVTGAIQATHTELDYCDVTTLGTVEASKAVTADSSGNIDFNNGNMTNVDIDSGAIDGTPIGAASASTGSFSTISASGAVVFDTTLRADGDATFGGSISASGSTTLSASLTLDGVISPTQLAADQNNYAPTGIGTAYTVRVDASADVNITGLSASQGEGREIVIENDGTANSIILNDENASSTAANRFALPDGADVVIGPESSVTLRYDGTASRWRIKGAAAGGGAVGGGSDQIMFANDQTSSGSGAGDYTLAATKNAVTAGTFTIASGDTITVSSGARWVIV